VEKINIIYESNVENYLNDLVHILFEEEYFGFMDSSIIFKDKIIDFIEDNIVSFPSRKTPVSLQYLGSNYIFYKSTQRTSWYVFFDVSSNNYLITSILNNNSEEVKWL